jgi:hypothetical protein
MAAGPFNRRPTDGRSPLVSYRALSAAFMLMAAPAAGIYIDPFPNGSGLAQNIPDTARPAAGIVLSLTGAECSGALIHSSIVPARSFALSAGHCGQIRDALGHLTGPAGDDDMSFFPGGLSGAPRSSDRLRTHPGNPWGGGLLGPDLMLMRLPAGTGPPLNLQRTPAAYGVDARLVGFGLTEPGGGGFGTKREAQFEIGEFTATGDGEANLGVIYLPTGSGTDADPYRRSCARDSGGPYILESNGRMVGVHSATVGAVPPGACNATGVEQVFTNVATAYVYNWIDSYTHRANFWDDLRVYSLPPGTEPPATPPESLPGEWTLEFSHGFESGEGGYGRGLIGYPGPPGSWETHISPHPTLTSPGLEPNHVNGSENGTRFRYFNAIGVANDGGPELFVEGASALGVVWTPESEGFADTIDRYFGLVGPFDNGTQVCTYVRQRWNSLGMGADLAMRHPYPSEGYNGMVWEGLSWAAESGDTAVDEWRWRHVCVTLDFIIAPGEPGRHYLDVAIHLLTVPDPATGVLLITGILSACPFRRHRRR